MTTIIEKNHAELIKELEDKHQKIGEAMLYMPRKTENEKYLWDAAYRRMTSLEKMIKELKRPPWKS